MTLSFKYVGDGSEHFHGVPARDLSGEDVGLLDSDQLRLVLESSIYEAVRPAPAPRKGGD